MTNHKEEAARLHSLASNDPRELAGIGAITQAVLYLAEQQRIANLIAYTAKLSSPPADLTNLHATDVSDFRVMVEAIRTGLGLA